jgi:hypothetical protein
VWKPNYSCLGSGLSQCALQHVAPRLGVEAGSLQARRQVKQAHFS